MNRPNSKLHVDMHSQPYKFGKTWNHLVGTSQPQQNWTEIKLCHLTCLTKPREGHS